MHEPEPAAHGAQVGSRFYGVNDFQPLRKYCRVLPFGRGEFLRFWDIEPAGVVRIDPGLLAAGYIVQIEAATLPGGAAGVDGNAFAPENELILKIQRIESHPGAMVALGVEAQN